MLNKGVCLRMVYLCHKPLLEGEKVVLRPFENKDLPFIEVCLKDPEVIKLTGSNLDFDKEKESIHHWYNTRNEQTDRLDLAIIDKCQGIPVGSSDQFI